MWSISRSPAVKQPFFLTFLVNLVSWRLFLNSSSLHPSFLFATLLLNLFVLVLHSQPHFLNLVSNLLVFASVFYSVPGLLRKISFNFFPPPSRDFFFWKYSQIQYCAHCYTNNTTEKVSISSWPCSTVFPCVAVLLILPSSPPFICGTLKFLSSLPVTVIALHNFQPLRTILRGTIGNRTYGRH